MWESGILTCKSVNTRFILHATKIELFESFDIMHNYFRYVYLWIQNLLVIQKENNNADNHIMFDIHEGKKPISVSKFLIFKV